MIKEHETWKILDSSKIEEFMRCPRRYFYRYIVGWTTDQPDYNLHFGTSWHKAMEHLLIKGYEPDAVAEACLLFEETYREYFPPETDEDRHPKTPMVAFKGISKYAATYKATDMYDKTLYVEIAGSVSIGDRPIHFKMDSIIERDGLVFTREHKTGSTMSRQWADRWKLSVQVGTYIHVLNCMFSQNKVLGAEINGAFFKKGARGSGGEVDFMRVPVRKTPEVMEDWLYTVRHVVDDINKETDKLLHTTEAYTVMPAFPKNATSCTSYSGCPYIDFCIAWSNPLQNIDEPPLGFVQKWWDPTENRERAKKIVEI